MGVERTGIERTGIERTGTERNAKRPWRKASAVVGKRADEAMDWNGEDWNG